MSSKAISPLTRPTGIACSDCNAPTFLVPGYLVEKEDGSRWFTVAEQTDHNPHCKVLDEWSDQS